MSHVPPEIIAALAERYAVESELGQGGMATVYLARDLKHNRQVAVKILRPELAAILGGERFLKEIEVTANLQHPNILPLYDSGSAGTFLYYVMPYLEGESLRQKLDREKQFAVDETIELAKEVAAALQFAHERGVIHRDIKPENILLQAGHALVADFGIALAVSQAGGTRLTETGLSLGTPHYMSPEQATGDRELDARSDVYSLGAMVYEMLTGEPPHLGNSVQAIVAKILSERPSPLSQSRDMVPQNVDAAVQCALAKSPADRFTDAAAFAAALTNQHYTLPTQAVPEMGRRRATLWNPLSVGATVLSLVLLTMLMIVRGGGGAASPVLRLGLALDSTEGLYFSGFADPPRVDLLPDGSGMVYVSASSGSPPRLVRRSFESLNGDVLPGTDFPWFPTVSGDGSAVAFLDQGGALKVASLAGGPPVTVLSAGVSGAGVWGPDRQLYYVDETRQRIKRIPAEGGASEDVVRFDSTDRDLKILELLPDERHALAVTYPRGGGEPEEADVRVVDLDDGTTRVLVAGVFGTYAAPGYLVYVSADGTLLGVPFDVDRAEINGRAVALAQAVDIRAGFVDVSLAENGTLVYTTQGINTPEEVVWVTRGGISQKIDPDWVRDVEFEGLMISPDGARLAVEIRTDGRNDIWVKELDRGPLSRLTFNGDANVNPTWSPDGLWVYYSSLRDDLLSIWRKRADGAGSEEKIVETDRSLYGAFWSPDGEWLILGGEDSILTADDISGIRNVTDILAVKNGEDTAPTGLIAGPFNESEPAISPDGRWIAYVSDESGELEVYVRPFPDVNSGRWQISTGGGSEPLWSRDGDELFFRATHEETIQVADMSNGPASASRSTAVQLERRNDYERNSGNRLYDVAPDGRFMMIQRLGTPDVAGTIIMVQNFVRDLEQRFAQ